MLTGNLFGDEIVSTSGAVILGENHSAHATSRLGGIANVSRALAESQTFHEIFTSAGTHEAPAVRESLRNPWASPTVIASAGQIDRAIILDDVLRSQRTSFVIEGGLNDLPCPDPKAGVDYLFISYLDRLSSFDRTCLERWRANGTRVIADLCLSFPDQRERNRVIEATSELTGLVISMSEFKAYFEPGRGVPRSGDLPGGLEFIVVHAPSQCWIVTKYATAHIEGVEVEGATVLAAGDRFAAKFLSMLVSKVEIQDAAHFAFQHMQGEFRRPEDEA